MSAFQSRVAMPAALRSIPGSRQAMTYGTDRYFAGKEKELAALIQSLLDPVMRQASRHQLRDRPRPPGDENGNPSPSAISAEVER